MKKNRLDLSPFGPGVVALALGVLLVSGANQALARELGPDPISPRSLLDADPKGLVPSAARYEVASHGSRLRIRYQFRGLRMTEHSYEWEVPATDVKQPLQTFGVPESIFEPFPPRSDVIEERRRILDQGRFRQYGNTIRPMFRELIAEQRVLLEPAVQQFRRDYPNASLAEAFQFWLHFTQEIPYGIPPTRLNGKFYAGFLPPAGVLARGWGDCDSKATLFAAAMSYFPNAKVIMVIVPGHQLVGVRMPPKEGYPTVKFEGEDYVLAEPVGTARLTIGQLGPQGGQTPQWMGRVVPFTQE